MLPHFARVSREDYANWVERHTVPSFVNFDSELQFQNSLADSAEKGDKEDKDKGGKD